MARIVLICVKGDHTTHQHWRGLRMSQIVPIDLDHFYQFGEVHETLDACDQLDMMLGRLKRRHILSEETWRSSKRHLTEIRSRIEERASSASR